MRFIPALLFLLSSVSYGASQEAMIVGNWVCEPYIIELEGDQGVFDVTHIVEYKENGTSTDVHTYKLRGLEEQVWVKVSHYGPWKVQKGVLIEETETTKIIDASIPDLKNSEEMLKVASFEDRTFISDIIELSKSTFTTKDKELDESSTCIKV